VLAQEIDHLPERERMVLSLYYERGLTLKEIGAVLDVTESRVCQIHTRAVSRLRARVASGSRLLRWRSSDEPTAVAGRGRCAARLVRARRNHLAPAGAIPFDLRAPLLLAGERAVPGPGGVRENRGTRSPTRSP